MLSGLNKKFFICLLTSYIAIFNLLSQNLIAKPASDDFPFKHIEYINSSQGLMGNLVSWITQDRNGFIWVITTSALNRYDGYTFRNYSYRPEVANSFKYGWYWGIEEDEHGKFWIPSNLNGLYSFDPRLEIFKQYTNQPGVKNSLVDNRIFSIASTGDGNFWLGMKENGLVKFDSRSESFIHFAHKDNDPSSISDNFIYSIVKEEVNWATSKQPNIYIINHKAGIDYFDTQNERVIKRFDFPYPNPFKLGEKFPDYEINMNIGKMTNGMIWLGSDDSGIYGFNTITEKYVQLKSKHSCKASKHIFGLYFVLEDSNGNLWTTNDDNEIVYYDRTKERFYYYQVDKNNILFIDNPVMFYEDNNQSIWMGSNNGLIKIDTKQKIINVSHHNVFALSFSPVEEIYGIRRIQNGPLLVATSSIIISFDPEKNNFSPLIVDKTGDTLYSPLSTTIYEDRKGLVWFCGLSGLISYDRLRKKTHLYQLRDENESKVSKRISNIVEDHQGRYWLAEEDGCLLLFNPDSNKVKRYKPDLREPKGLGNFGPPFIDARNQIYIPALEGGFITFNPESKKFKIMHHRAEDPASVSHETCHSFFEDKNGLIWLGTFGGGINVFDPKTEKFKSFTTREGLIQDEIKSIVADKKGRFWAVTNGGISSFEIPDRPFAPDCKIIFRNYDMRDGLPSYSFYSLSAYCDTDGTLYFGNRQGLVHFKPDDLKDNDIVPPVIITGFQLMNKTVKVNDLNSVLKTSIEYTREIKLNYRQDAFSFSFTALNYLHPEKNKYAFMLEGYDEDWIYTDASKRFATYTNLAPKKYRFKVKASNNDDKWNESPTELTIIITPPFWQTAWFKFLVIVAITGAVYAVYRYRLEQVLKLQKIRNRIAADLHDDIGSTLNSISVFSEVAKNDPTKRNESLDMIGDSSRKVTEAMSDIVWTINPDNDSFGKMILRMRSLSYNLLRAKNIEFTFRADEELNNVKLSMETRKNFFMIFKEILNNLIKHSQASGASFSITRSDNKYITLTMQDNGTGFDPTKTFSGNGLNNIRSRTKEMAAKLIIESGNGKGTNIQLIIKL